MFTLRPYQREAVDRTLAYFRRTSKPGVLVLPTGAGKSLVIAALARLARHRILVLAHVKELVEQNHQKFCQYTHSQDDPKADIFSAGLGQKQAQSQVVFASIQSASVNLPAFSDYFSLVVIDECHRVGEDDQSQYQMLLAHLRQFNPELKVLGLTATPYRLNSGWIYQRHLIEKCVRGDDKAFFSACIYELPLKYLIDQGFLTPLKALDAPVAFYDFSQLENSGNQQLWQAVINQAKRATPKIVAQLIDLSRDRLGVMIFAASVDHAKEIHQLLPPENSAVILGSMNQRARDSVVNAFKAKQIKYLVNVSVLTTGFDAPHVDTIAMLRPTQSVGLYQQIVGRGLRLSEGKDECLVLDYAGNGYDVFRPEISEPKSDSKSVPVVVPCPVCGYKNDFWGLVDSDGDIIEHYGRRCQGLVASQNLAQAPSADVELDLLNQQQCDFRFRFKECPQCNSENDIAARQCHQCHYTLIDPDDQLKKALSLADCKVIRCAGLSFHSHTKKSGQNCLKVIYHDEQGEQLSEYFSIDTDNQRWAFDHHFARHALKNPGQNFKSKTLVQVLGSESLFQHPDFVIARKDKNKRGPVFWQISEKIYRYQGRYRKANEL